MTRKIVTHIPQEKFLSIRLIATAWWASFFACWWCRALELGDPRLLGSGAYMFLAGALTFSLVTYGMNVRTEPSTDV